jgi:aspartate/methionine/tyrosine aminotransferase
LKKAVAGYLGNILNLSRAITAENVFIAGGVGSALDCLMHLICDPGDGLLLSTPCYGMFKVDCSLRSKVKLILVNKTSGTSRPLSSDTLKPTVEEYERAYQKAIQEGVTVRALLVTNPHNPIGYILTKEELQQLVQFAHKHSIHLIVDEIYMKSLVNPDAKFTSVLELEDIPNPDLVHIVWGPSKDFGIPGFKTGFVISCGTTVSKAYDGMGMDFYYSVNKIGQDILAAMLSDWDWLSKVYFPTQMELSRKALKIVTSAFDDLGVPYLRPDAGLFVYTDLRKYVAKLSKDPREGEIKLMNKFVKSGRVYWPSGSTLCMSVEFGWFRPIFTARLDHLEEGIKRICSVLKEIEEMQ